MSGLLLRSACVLAYAAASGPAMAVGIDARSAIGSSTRRRLPDPVADHASAWRAGVGY